MNRKSLSPHVCPKCASCAVVRKADKSWECTRCLHHAPHFPKLCASVREPDYTVDVHPLASREGMDLGCYRVKPAEAR